MIANIKTRVDFGGIVNYANDQKNKKKSATLLAHEGVCTVSNKTIADSFQIQASMRPKVKSPVKHVSLAFSPQDAARFPNDEKGDALMVEIARKWMERFNRNQASDKVHGVSFSQDSISLAGSTLDRDLSFNSLCTTLGNLTEELLLQPHQAIISSAGGGTSNSLGWRDEKDKNSPKNEPFYKPLKRGR